MGRVEKHFIFIAKASRLAQNTQETIISLLHVSQHQKLTWGCAPSSKTRIPLGFRPYLDRIDDEASSDFSVYTYVKDLAIEICRRTEPTVSKTESGTIQRLGTGFISEAGESLPAPPKLHRQSTSFGSEILDGFLVPEFTLEMTTRNLSQINFEEVDTFVKTRRK